ncbi:MAG TPA: ABC transporter permease [Ktedonobacterales bacterium]|nr:ABC transporter permease [Ktedonobacterales bacterium]
MHSVRTRCSASGKNSSPQKRLRSTGACAACCGRAPESLVDWRSLSLWCSLSLPPICVTQFALWRTLGMARRHIGAVLAGELIASTLLAQVSGTVLAVVLAVTPPPVLGFSATTASVATVDTPPVQFAFSPQPIAAFYAVLLGAIMAALFIAVSQTMKLGLGRTLRVGED